VSVKRQIGAETSEHQEHFYDRKKKFPKLMQILFVVFVFSPSKLLSAYAESVENQFRALSRIA
jgi:hypothetical protein